MPVFMVFYMLHLQEGVLSSLPLNYNSYSYLKLFPFKNANIYMVEFIQNL